MISSLTVGAEFSVVDAASPVLIKISDSLKEMQGLIDKTKESFKALSESGFTGLTGRIDALGESLGAVEKSSASIGGNLDRAMTTVAGSITAVGDSIGTLTGKIAALNIELDATGNRAARTAERAATGAAASVAAGGLGPGSGGRGGGGGGWLPSLTAPEMRAGGFGFAAGAMGGPAGVGVAAGVYLSYEAVKAAAQFDAIREQMRIGGVSPAEIDKATREAMTIGPKYGMEPADFLKSINETRNILNKGSTPDMGVEGALAHGKTMAQASLVLRAQGGEKGGDVGRDLYDLVKSAEFRNAISDKEFDKAISSMVQSDVATGGVVNPRTWLQMSQYLKGALPGLSNDFLYSYMPELAQEFKGSGAGTTMASLYQQLVAGQMRTSGLRLLDQIGMVDESKVDFDKNGRIVKARPGYFKDDDVFKANPLQGIEDIVKAMQSHGITDEKEQRDYITMLFGNRNAAQIGLTLAYQDLRLNRGAQGIKSTWELEPAANELLASDPMTQFRKAWADMDVVLLDIGQNALPPVLGGLKVLDEGLKGLHDILTRKGAISEVREGEFVGGLLGASEIDKVWSDFQSQFKPGDLPNLPDLGPIPNAGGGASWNPLKWFHKSGYTGGGSLSGDTGGMAAQTINILAGVVNLAKVDGSYGGSSGFMNVAYDPDSDAGVGGTYYSGGSLHSGGGYTLLGGSRSGGGGGFGGGGLAGISTADLDKMAANGDFPDTVAGRAAFIRHSAMKMGIDPDYALRVAKSEGLFSTLPNHQNLSGYNVFGDFQLNYARGVGVAAMAAGIEPSDWKRSDLFALNWMRVHGMNDWLASGHSGAVPRYYGPDPGNVAATPPRVRGRSFHGGAVGDDTVFESDHTDPSINAHSKEIHLHTAIHVDGKKLAGVVQKHIVRANAQVYGASKHDGLAQLTPIDAGFQWER